MRFSFIDAKRAEFPAARHCEVLEVSQSGYFAWKNRPASERQCKPRHLRGQRLRRLLPVGRVKLAKIARDTLLQLSTPPFHLRPCEILVPVVHGLELAAIDGSTRRRQETHLAHTLRSAKPLSLRKSAIVLRSGTSRPSSHITSTLRPASRSSRRLDCTRFR
jgi:hypothetical protein